MHVYRHPPRWDTEKQDYHVVEKKGYVIGGEKSLLLFQIHAMCDQKFSWDKKGVKYKYEEYDRAKHKKGLCAECVRLTHARIAAQKLKLANLKRPLESQTLPSSN